MLRMKNAYDKALLLNALKEQVFDNPDLFRIIRTFVDCDTITNFCLVNENWCTTMLDNRKLRLQVAECLVHRINKNLTELSMIPALNVDDTVWIDDDDVQVLDGEDEDDGEEEEGDEEDGDEEDEVEVEADIGWVPTDPLFVEFDQFKFAASIQVPPTSGLAKDFLEEHVDFESKLASIANALSKLYGVKIDEVRKDEDIHDKQYMAFIYTWSPPIKDTKNDNNNLIRLLPFTSVVQGHDGQLRMSPVSRSKLENIQFEELFKWDRPRRSQRNILKDVTYRSFAQI